METVSTENYAALLEEAVSFNGHVCGGIESGTRMAIFGVAVAENLVLQIYIAETSVKIKIDTR
jgi:hypothetical protein